MCRSRTAHTGAVTGNQEHGAGRTGFAPPGSRVDAGVPSSPPVGGARSPSSGPAAADVRPGLATAAGVLGFVVAGFAVLTGAGATLRGLRQDVGWAPVLLLTGVLVAIALVVGGTALLRRRSSRLLQATSALLTLAVLAGMGTAVAVEPSDGPYLAFALAVFWLPLPLLVLVFSSVPVVRRWLRGGRRERADTGQPA